MRRTMALIVLALTVVNCAGSQSALDFEAKYRRVVSYEIRPGIVMTPEYSSDGQVCEMTLEHRQKTATGLVLADSFTGDDVAKLVDELVPSVDRGKPSTDEGDHGGASAFLSSSIIVMTEAYENVIVDKIALDKPKPGRIMVVEIAWRNRACKNSNVRSMPDVLQ